MSNADDKLEKILETVFEMKPILSEVREDQKTFDIRLRSVESTGIEHKIKIERIQLDVDGLGKKFRDIPIIVASPKASDKNGFIDSLVGVLTSVPKFWHVILSAAMFIMAVVTSIWKHK